MHDPGPVADADQPRHVQSDGEPADLVVLVKASRSVGLERVALALVDGDGAT